MHLPGRRRVAAGKKKAPPRRGQFPREAQSDLHNSYRRFGGLFNRGCILISSPRFFFSPTRITPGLSDDGMSPDLSTEKWVDMSVDTVGGHGFVYKTTAYGRCPPCPPTFRQNFIQIPYCIDGGI